MASGRQALARALTDRFAAIPHVVSATLVGSFAELSDARAASDVDVVVICDELKRATFDHCLGVAGTLTGADLGRPECAVRINSTFGPLKFDDPAAVVLHLMVYDVAGHRHHVLSSPFTCYDWERATTFSGQSLAQVYPVLCLQPRDFIAARRGLADYASDLSHGSISFRRYDWDADGIPRQVVERAPLDARHSGEYAYHIIRNLVRNYAKLLSSSNLVLDDDAFDEFWMRNIPSARELIAEFQRLRAQKASGDRRFDAGAIALAIRFLEAFASELRHTWERARRVWWVRHARTDLNDGTFLGQGRDPELGVAALDSPLSLAAETLYSSPARRTVATARSIALDAPLIRDARLHEQNYGAAEGLTLQGLATAHPAVIQAWNRGEDPPFPEGESLAEVRQRLGAFTEELLATGGGNVAVVTHNVVMREMLGGLLGVPPTSRFRLSIPHLEPFETVQQHDRLFPQLTIDQKAAITDSLVKR